LIDICLPYNVEEVPEGRRGVRPFTGGRDAFSVRAELVEALALKRQPFDKLRANGFL
jgi:hypothetical protein